MQVPHVFRYGRPRPLVFAFDRGQNRLYARRQAAVEITGPEARRDFFINDTFAERIRQRTFQPIAHLEKHFVVLNENEEHRSVVFIFLAHLPRARHPYGVIVNGRVRLHLRKHSHDDLVGGLAFKLLKQLIQSCRRRGRGDVGVIIEIRGGRRGNDFRPPEPDTENQK